MHDALPEETTLPGSSPRSLDRVGSPVSWARDFALVGAATGLLAPTLLMGVPVYLGLASAAGALTGGLLGFMIPHGLRAGMARVPVGLLMLFGPALGLVWGGAVGWVAGMSLGAPMLSAVVASLAGAVQFGWFWYPYLRLRLARRRSWPLVAAAAVAAPVLGTLGGSVVMRALLGTFPRLF